MRTLHPARIVLSENMKRQGYKAPKTLFPNADKAYSWGLKKWGSGTYDGILDWTGIYGSLYMGWAVKERNRK